MNENQLRMGTRLNQPGDLGNERGARAVVASGEPVDAHCRLWKRDWATCPSQRRRSRRQRASSMWEWTLPSAFVVCRSSAAGSPWRMPCAPAARASRSARSWSTGACLACHPMILGGTSNLLQCLLHMAQVESALGVAESTVKVANLGKSWSMCSTVCDTTKSLAKRTLEYYRIS